MAALSRTGSFYKTIKQVSVTAIERESLRPVRLLIVGAYGDRTVLMRDLFLDNTEEGRQQDDGSLLFFDTTDPASGFPDPLGADDIVIDFGGGLAPDTTAAHYYNVEELGGMPRLMERLIEMRPDLWLALGRRFPALRRGISEKIVHETATTNAEWAMLNALPGVIPFAAWLLPTAAIGDILMLTKNQMMMMYRLAVAHGLPVDLPARSKDLGPLFGGALGWRAIARELVAIVPGGVGLVARGAIAYAGTAALGKAIIVLYQTGKISSRGQLTGYYKEALGSAKRIAAERLSIIRGRKPSVDLTIRKEPRPALEDSEQPVIGEA